MAECPKCEAPIAYLVGGGIDTTFVGAPARKSVIYACPHCQTAISCEIDPIALQVEIVSQIEESLARILRSR